ncbi:hypothetical protein JI739_00880 [Ramlibacter sp. AW1]|uniref:Transmembrane protein n=1 Tax=Ramlibacter aurantiacus TaxID=2801330 RepID=A0A936ZQL3_9BURK|nr:hypothetical protein [Ramlibacter aurantiacus]MBL0418889.1 hypothetical protein [Ramlibacter aurantiacus]
MSHSLMTRAGDAGITLLVVLGPLVLLGIGGLWQSGRKVLALGCTVGAALAVAGLRGQALSPALLYLAQHAGIHAALAAWFGSTLRRGSQPLITALAARVHGGMTPAMAGYTRRLTAVWTLYFLAMTTASLLLYACGDFDHWSLFANLLTPVFTVLMFVGEYLLRYRLHPEFDRVGLAAGFRAWQASGRSPK